MRSPSGDFPAEYDPMARSVGKALMSSILDPALFVKQLSQLQPVHVEERLNL